MTTYNLIATTTFGMESVVKNEVNKLNFKDIKVSNGKVEFKGNEKDICRANLWLRSAERVQIKVGEFKATNFDQLYEKTKELPWDWYLTKDANFPVSGKSVKSQLHHVPTCQSITKKAIVDCLTERYNKSWFEEKGPKYQIEVALYKDTAILTLDTSGRGLHKRGYRELSSTAPLQETIAAGMITLSKWSPDRILIDPFVGSGTIPIEAAMKAKNIAPGLNRSFDFENWHFIKSSDIKEVRNEAHSLIKKDIEPRLIAGYDLNPDLVSMGRYHAKKAQVSELIHFQEMDFKDFSTNRKYGYIITNPPYGIRLSDKTEVEKLYKIMGKKLLKLDTWSYYILSAYEKFEEVFNKKASKRRKLYNGGIKVDFYQYYGPWPPRDNK
ncbi:MAG: class I SAM-dependent RNA methyltransferase [Halanaerobiales bacterium]|nr:class I SAM-dependent RNA methyltransferase [Halanaerobiales bacterium]